MEHAEGPSAPFFESPHSLSTITSVSLPIYTFKTRLFQIEQNKNTKKLFFFSNNFEIQKKTKKRMIDYVSRSDYVQNSVGSVEFDDSTDGSWVRYTTYFRGRYGLLRATTDLNRFHWTNDFCVR